MKRFGVATLLAMAGCASAYAQQEGEVDPTLALLSSASQGSSVVLYGVIDVNVEYLSHAGANGGSLVRENSGGIHNSRFGFRGTEDLGGGNTAWFVLEAGFNTNDGSAATSGTLFNRTAAVGLSNRTLGSLSFGLQYSAMYDILLQYDPMQYAPQYTWFPTTGSSDDFAFRARNSNTVKYVGQFGRVTAIAEYAFGNDATSFQSDAAYGAGLNYDGGSFGAALAYDYRNGAINSKGNWTKSRNLSLTFRQNLGNAVLLAGYEHYLETPTAGASLAQSLWFAGVRYRLLPQMSVTAAAYYDENDAPNTSNSWMGVLSTQYFLSKQTALYATVAYAQATRYGNDQYTPVGTTDSTAFGPNQTGVTLGIFHKF